MAQKTAVKQKAQAKKPSASVRREWSDLAVCTTIGFAAFFVRLICLFQIESIPVFYHLPGDPLAYDLWAQRIVAGDWIGQSVFYQAPLYPYFLAVLQLFLGHDLWAIRVAQLILGAAACSLIYLTGKNFFSRTAGIAAALLLCFYGPAVFYGSVIDKTVTDLFLVTLLLYLVSVAAVQPQRWNFLAIGAALGLLALSRENALIWLPLLPIWVLFYFHFETPKVRWQRLALFVFGLALVLLPVGLRNYAVGGQLALTTSQMGPNFYIGNNPSADGTYGSIRLVTGEKQFEQAEARRLAEQAAGRPLTLAEVSSYWMGRALDYIRTEPAEWLFLLWKKWLIVWNVRELEDSDDFYLYQKWSWLLALLGWINFGVLAPLAAAGVAAKLNEWRKLWLLCGLLLSFAAGVALFFVFGRYRFPLTPFLTLFAAVAIVESIELYRRQRFGRLAALAAVALLAAVFVYWPVVGRPGPSAPGYTYLANGYAKQGNIDDAIRSAQAALQIDPSYGVAHYNLANFYVERRRFDEAISHYQHALKVYPRYLDARGNLGRAFALAGKFSEAVEQYGLALKLQPNEPRIYLGLGEVAVLRGQFGEAIEHLNNAVKHDPSSPLAHTNLGRVFAAQGDLKRAIGHFREAVRLAPESAEARRNLALALAEAGMTDDSLQQRR
ncbi:MAG: tetratricopeptide repeat protein [Deltaproteobacteria bacterium]|nr:tetratricopeptide repeat protein [Deltaproteobacteria bacterium]